MISYFAIGDPHFGHYAIMKHCQRPFDTMEQHDEEQIRLWNETVPKKHSIVIIFGDFAFKNHMSYFHRLNGKKILIVGNHDHMSQESYNNFTEIHESAHMIKVNGKQYWCSHYCHRVWPQGHYGVPHIFAHSHGRLTTFNMSIDCGVDTKLSNFRPIPFFTMEAEFEIKRQKMEIDKRIVIENGKKLYRQDDVSFALKQMESI